MCLKDMPVRKAVFANDGAQVMRLVHLCCHSKSTLQLFPSGVYPEQSAKCPGLMKESSASPACCLKVMAARLWRLQM